MTQHIFRGMDRTEMEIDVASTLFGLMFATAFIWRYGYLYLWVALGLILVLALSFGARWRLTFTPEGITLERWRFWFIPRRATHFNLEASFDYYWSAETKHPIGIAIDEVTTEEVHANEIEVCFGPKNPDAIKELIESFNKALAEVREA